MVKNVKKKLIMWQPPMKTVMYALTPLVLASIYFFGWRSLLIFAVVNLAGFLTEFIYTKHYNEPVSSAVFVTNFLFSLILPPTIPIWMAVVGIIIAVLFGKMVFGGFGRNIFNPALVGRAFLYVSFGLYMTGKKAWVEPFSGILGGLGRWSSDAFTGATPLKIAAEGGAVCYTKMLIGNISGCMGETSAILIILGGLYIIYKKAASYEIVFSGIISMLLFQSMFWYFKISNAVDPLTALLSGGFLLGIFFMATDPVSASSVKEGKWIYGALIGTLTALIRTFSSWPEGIMFAILLANMFAPITDYAIREYKKSKKGA